MKFGEKLQKLRKQSGLSQEQLAARLTVSRQAVSKWELDDTMPDTENVVQLSRIFGVSCDYLLREEVGEPSAALAVRDLPQPAQPGGAHLDRQGWIHNAFTLALGLCALGLVGGLMSYRFNGHTVRPLAIGFMIQLLGMVLFELATPRMGDRRNAARLRFYATACCLVVPIPYFLAFSWVLDNLLGWQGTPLRALIYFFTGYILLAAAVPVALLFLRRRQSCKE